MHSVSGSASSEALEQRRQRKKIQNRLNQRARRLRHKDQQAEPSTGQAPSSYQVYRWRLDEDDSAPWYGRCNPPSGSKRDLRQRHGHEGHRPSMVGKQGTSQYAGRAPRLCLASLERFDLTGTPQPDRLFHLVQHNALRGLVANKELLATFATLLIPHGADGSPCQLVERVYPGRAALVTASKRLPRNMHPTLLQSNSLHSTWLNLLPCPRMRDNMIRREAQFDHFELAYDIVGDFMDLSHFFRPSIREPGTGTRPEKLLMSEPRAETHSRKGLVLWGEPHEIENWEVTPGYVQKWGWTLQGCRGLLEATNRWRRLRDEEMLDFPTTLLK
ncbi:hypothetical protein S40288_06468 [Stachybotrys chartarum IBT 40288]|nr:hypothetical protein S40288_06468 [Stachybotrys chartarum IBT 40288]